MNCYIKCFIWEWTTQGNYCRVLIGTHVSTKWENGKNHFALGVKCLLKQFNQTRYEMQDENPWLHVYCTSIICLKTRVLSCDTILYSAFFSALSLPLAPNPKHISDLQMKRNMCSVVIMDHSYRTFTVIVFTQYMIHVTKTCVFTIRK